MYLNYIWWRRENVSLKTQLAALISRLRPVIRLRRGRFFDR